MMTFMTISAKPHDSQSVFDGISFVMMCVRLTAFAAFGTRLRALYIAARHCFIDSIASPFTLTMDCPPLPAIRRCQHSATISLPRTKGGIVVLVSLNALVFVCLAPFAHVLAMFTAFFFWCHAMIVPDMAVVR
jgi:hypothetical protein